MVPARAARLLFQLPQDSRVMRAVQPANHWGWQEMLLNKATHILEVLAWQQTEDGQAGKNAPQLFQPDFIRNAITAPSIDPEQVTRSTDEIAAILARPRT